MKAKPKDFCVPEGEIIKLEKWATKVPPYFANQEEYKQILSKHVRGLDKLQRLMGADGRYSLLLIFQGMDAAGKDGAIRHVLTGINPQGCEVHSFKTPSALELDHDFLWRTTCELPERGRIGIFNRSYYEEVLITHVHPEILASQKLPKECLNRKRFWAQRYESILDLEKHLHRNGTRIIKIFLHLSKEEQRRRFLDRIDNPDKNWKFSGADIKERNYWDQYMTAFEECLSATSTEHAPWYVVPADDKENARLIISRIVLDTMKKMKMAYPETDQKRRDELQEIRQTLVDSSTESIDK